jgi:4-hydroxy-3-polyprenylbenzoate decarboxylase
MGNSSKRLVVGISGASGVIYGLEMLKVLKDLGYETHVVMTEMARSNSFITRGMVVIPCSIKSLSGIARSYNANLLVRAADVTLKERRPLVLVVRETPLHRGHLELLLSAASQGAVILPPVPAFYHKPKTILDLIHHTIGKVLDCFHIPHELFQRWQGL